MNLEVVFGNIVDAKTDAILNCANSFLERGGGVCGAIFEKAGVKELERECKEIGCCEIGKAVITKGYNLNAKYIIHAVGPIYHGRKGDSDLLNQAYLNALALADEHEIKSFALCSISTGIFGFPIEKAIPIALNAIHNFEPKSLEKCYMYCIDEKTYDCFLKAEQNYRRTHNSLNKMPTKVFVDYIKNNSKICHTDDELKEQIKNSEKQFELMKTITWEEFESLSKEELERIPIGWIYDWTHVCGGGYYHQAKVEELYKKYNLPTEFNTSLYLKKFGK